MKKQIILLLIILISVFTLISCKNDKEVTDDVTISDYQGMNIIEEIGMKNVFESNIVYRIAGNKYDGFTNPHYYNNMFSMDDIVYITAKKFHEDDSFRFNDIILHSFNVNDGDGEALIIKPFNEDGYINFMWYDSEYNHITIEELNYEYVLYKSTHNGEIIYSIPLNINETIISMALGEDDNIYIGTEKSITIYSNDGKYITSLQLQNQLLYISSAHGKKPILKLKKSNIYDFPKYQYLNVETESLENIEMSSDIIIHYDNSHIIYGNGYDYYHITNNGIYGYDIESNTLTKTLDWTNSDINYSDVVMVSCVSPEKAFMFSFEYTTQYFTILNHIPNNELPQKEYISIAHISTTDDVYLNDVVRHFNKQNENCKIILTNYYLPYAELDPILRLNNDIASGKTPDMIYMNNYLSLTNYSIDDMFVDLYEYLKEDEELYNNLLPLASESAALKGKLYQMITDFFVWTLIGKTEDFNYKLNWSYRDAINLYENMSDNVIMGFEFTRDLFIYYYLTDAISEYVNYTNGTCNFNSKGFKDFLEFLKLLPIERNSEDQKEFMISHYKYLYSKCRNNEMVLYKTFISNAMNFATDSIQAFRDKDTVMIGYPTSDGTISGDVISTKGFSILNSSKNKDVS